jgi:hypothetical protein
MAENLGTIDIAVKADESQVKEAFDKALGDGGKKAGKSISDSLSSIMGKTGKKIGDLTHKALGKIYGVGGMRGPESGPTKYGSAFGSSMKGSMAGTRIGAIAGRIGAIAGPIAVVAGVVIALGVIVKKIISAFIGLAKTLSSMAHKYAGINAEMAVLSAKKKVGGLARDMRFAHMIAPATKEASKALSGLKDAILPLKAYAMTVLQMLGTEVIGIVTDILKSLGELLVTFGPLIEAVLMLTRVILRMLRIIFTIRSNPIGFLQGLITGKSFDMFNFNDLKEGIEGTNTALGRILKEIKDGKDDQWIENWNAYMANVGAQLSGGAWNPKFNTQAQTVPSNGSNSPSSSSLNTGLTIGSWLLSNGLRWM